MNENGDFVAQEHIQVKLAAKSLLASQPKKRKRAAPHLDDYVSDQLQATGSYYEDTQWSNKEEEIIQEENTLVPKFEGKQEDGEVLGAGNLSSLSNYGERNPSKVS